MHRSSWVRSIAVVAGILGLPAVVAAQARTFDRVTYTAPAGWKVDESNGGYVAIAKTGKDSYCMVVIYASTPAANSLEASYAAEWQSVALKTIAPVAAPTPTVATIGSARAVAGGAASTIQGQPVAALFFVLDAGASVVSILVLSPSVEAFAAYTADVQAMLASVQVRRADAAAPPPPPAGAAPAGGRPVVPPPTRAITLGDLAGEWKNEDGITTTYVYRDTGSYAGSDSIHTREKWTITAKGTIVTDFFAIRNGKKLIEQGAGEVKVIGQILDVRRKVGSPQQFVIRGWLEAPTMTVLKINGPWYDGKIPPDVLANPAQGANLDQLWVRSKETPPPK